MKIFLVEDDKTLREYIYKYLKKNGFIIYCFNSAEEFLSDAKLEDNDCLILDINLPKKNGFELLDNINKRKLKLKVIIISVSKDIENIEKAFSLGVIDYLKKPFELKELLLRIQNIFKIKHNPIHTNNELDGIDLSKNERYILDILLSNSSSIISLEMIQDFMHDYQLEDIKKSSIRNILTNLKKKISYIDIQNIYGEGYKINKKKKKEKISLDSLQEVSNLLSKENNLHNMFKIFCDYMFKIFNPDRVFVMYVDFDINKLIVPYESSNENYPGAGKLNIQVPINDIQLNIYKSILKLTEPLILNHSEMKKLLKAPYAEIWEQMVLPKSAVIFHFNIKDVVWICGVHQCSFERVWTDEEITFLKHCTMILEKEMYLLNNNEMKVI